MACPLLAWPEGRECVLAPWKQARATPGSWQLFLSRADGTAHPERPALGAIQKWDGYILELSFLLPIQMKAVIASENNPLLTTRCRCFPGIMQSLEETD